MWTQHWPITELRGIDREARRVICENGGKHPLSSTAIMYFSREKGGRGLRSLEREYKLAAMKLCQNVEPLYEGGATVRRDCGREGTHFADEGST